MVRSWCPLSQVARHAEGVGSESGHSVWKSSPPPQLAVSELAQRQWGVLARAQLLSLGVSTAVVDAWVQRGRLHRVHQGVYALGHSALRA